MLSDRERVILEAVCDALIPPPLDAVAPSPAEMGRFVERFVEAMPPLSNFGFRAGLWTLAVSARLHGRRAIHLQDRAARAAVLARLESSRWMPLRLALKVVAGLGLMALYSFAPVRVRLELPA